MTASPKMFPTRFVWPIGNLTTVYSRLPVFTFGSASKRLSPCLRKISHNKAEISLSEVTGNNISITFRRKPMRPWDPAISDTFYAVDDILIRGAKLDDPEVQNDAPLLKLPYPWEENLKPELFPADHREHLLQQLSCMRASKSPEPKALRTTPKKSKCERRHRR